MQSKPINSKKDKKLPPLHTLDEAQLVLNKLKIHRAAPKKFKY
jgi:hypothetical protein